MRPVPRLLALLALALVPAGGCVSAEALAALKDDHATLSIETTVPIIGLSQKITRSNPYPPATRPAAP